jgi:hypothetical protein
MKINHRSIIFSSGIVIVTLLFWVGFPTITWADPSLPMSVSINIKPGDYSKCIDHRSRGKIPIAILSTPTFNAPDVLDQSTLSFGSKGDEESIAFCSKYPPVDVNGDGLYDLICHFNMWQIGFRCFDTIGILKGKTVDGKPIEGKDSVMIVPCR